MVRVLTALFACSACIVPVMTAADEIARSYDASVGMEFGFVKTSGYTSWTEGSVGKLRHASDGAVMNRLFFDLKGRLADTLNARVVLEAYDDDLGNAIDFTQAFLEWRPVPRSATRYRLKAGAFYPRISLENVDAGWSSPYTLNSSAINTWVAEEIRTIGAEVSMRRRPESLGGAHVFELDVAAFVGNDPAGSLLAWKGWSVHDRQSRFGDELPLPPMPLLEPGRMFEAQDPYVAPFREIDGRAGYYVNAQWRYANRFLVRAMHYDNRADPTVLENGQYAWATKFEHIGLQTTLPGEIGLIVQWMFGSTVMGPVINGVHVVDTEFDSEFILLTRAFNRNRFAIRYDHFEMTQNDQTPEENNPEKGHAWTFSYQFGLSKRASITAEWLSIKTHRCAFVYYGLPETVTETQLQLTLKLRL